MKARLRRLEGRRLGGRCPECGLSPDEPGRIVLIDDDVPSEDFPDNPGECCERCGRPLYTVVRLVYHEEGEGAIADA